MYVLTAAALVRHTQVSWVSSLRLVPAGGSFCQDQRKHLPDNAGVSRAFINVYMDYAGLGFPIDSAIALRTLKTRNTGAYGREAVFRPSLVIGTL